MDPLTLDALTSPAGRGLLESLPTYESSDSLTLATVLRARGVAPELAAAAMTQARLRDKARSKLGDDVDRMLFTTDGMEQATRREVADRRAARIASHVDKVADLGCGIGTDAIAYARAGLRVLAVEIDPLTAAVASANVAALGLNDLVAVVVGDATEVDLGGWQAAYVDPARRRNGRRLQNPRDWSPPLSFVTDLCQRMPTVAKVAPGLDHDLVPPGAQAEWVSVAGDLVECTLWCGALAEVPGHRATLLPSGATLNGPALEPPVAQAPRRYLYEPDSAVIRAGLVADVAALVDGTLLDPTIAYVSSDSLVRTPFATVYAVDDVVPFSLKRVRALLQSHNACDVVVKKRGTAVEPETFRRQLKLKGSGPRVTIVLTRVLGQHVAILVRPI